jgi:hypothetical protein
MRCPTPSFDVGQRTASVFPFYLFASTRKARGDKMFKNKQLRRFLGVTLVVGGGLLMWLAPDARAGMSLLAAGIGIELIGIWLERERHP